MSIVKEFHLRFGQPAPDFPPLIPDVDLLRLRGRMIAEEYAEVMVELEALMYEKDPSKVVELFRNLLKELADLRYVTEGTAVAYGLPFDAAYKEVHRSNMTKQAGKPGEKAIKGASYTPADMEQFVHHYTENE